MRRLKAKKLRSKTVITGPVGMLRPIDSPRPTVTLKAAKRLAQMQTCSGVRAQGLRVSVGKTKRVERNKTPVALRISMQARAAIHKNPACNWVAESPSTTAKSG